MSTKSKQYDEAWLVYITEEYLARVVRDRVAGPAREIFDKTVEDSLKVYNLAKQRAELKLQLKLKYISEGDE